MLDIAVDDLPAQYYAEDQHRMNYFEIHVTFDPMHRKEVEEFGRQEGWKVSHLKGDPIMGDDLLMYATKHCNLRSASFTSLNLLLEYARINEIPVLRHKIEAVIHDVRL